MDYMTLAILFGVFGVDRKSTRLNSSHTVIYTLSLHDALPISLRLDIWRRDVLHLTSRVADQFLLPDESGEVGTMPAGESFKAPRRKTSWWASLWTWTT